MPSIPPETLPEPAPRARPGAMLAPLAAVVMLGALPLTAASGLAGGDWGVPSLAALPAWVGPGSIVLALLLAAAAAWLAGGDRLRAWAGPIGGTLLAGFAVLAWCARIATLVYGDGLTLVSSLLDHAPLPPLEPLAQGTHVAMFTLWRALGARARVDPAWDAISAVSVLSGVLAVLLLVGIARRTTADLAEPAPARVFLPALVLAHGHVVLFFGYPENYAPVMAAVLLYIACACSALCAPRFAPWAGVALAVACLTHAMAIVLVPSYVTLLWSLRRERPAMMKNMVPDHVWKLVARYGLERGPDE